MSWPFSVFEVSPSAGDIILDVGAEDVTRGFFGESDGEQSSIGVVYQQEEQYDLSMLVRRVLSSHPAL